MNFYRIRKCELKGLVPTTMTSSHSKAAFLLFKEDYLKVVIASLEGRDIQTNTKSGNRAGNRLEHIMNGLLEIYETLPEQTKKDYELRANLKAQTW